MLPTTVNQFYDGSTVLQPLATAAGLPLDQVLYCASAEIEAFTIVLPAFMCVLSSPGIHKYWASQHISVLHYARLQCSVVAAETIQCVLRFKFATIAELIK
jgi:hypothetical protein